MVGIVSITKNMLNNFNISIISNITLEPYISQYIKQAFSELNIFPDIHFIQFESYAKGGFRGPR